MVSFLKKVIILFLIVTLVLFVSKRKQEYHNEEMIHKGNIMIDASHNGQEDLAIELLIYLSESEISNDVVLSNVSTLLFSYHLQLHEEHGMSYEEIYKRLISFGEKSVAINPSLENVHVLSQGYILPFAYNKVFKDVEFEWKRCEEVLGLLQDKYTERQKILPSRNGLFTVSPKIWQSKCNFYGGDYKKAMECILEAESINDNLTLRVKIQYYKEQIEEKLKQEN